jgi:hypothetical protein
MLSLLVYASVAVLRAYGAPSANDSVLPTISSYPFIMLEHVNIGTGGGWNYDFENFYVNGLGMVHDPRSAGVLKKATKAGSPISGLTWCNIGLQQLHFPADEEQRVNGVICLQYEDLSVVEQRLKSSEIVMDSMYDAEGKLSRIEVTCPMGNRFRLSEQRNDPVHLSKRAIDGAEDVHHADIDEKASATTGVSWLGPAAHIEPTDKRALPGGRTLGLGMSHVVFYTPLAAAEKICAFYNFFFVASAYVSTDPDLNAPSCVVPMGYGQFLRYTENPLQQRPYDGHHIAMYIQEFSAVYTRLAAHNLIWENPRFPQFSYRTLTNALYHNEFRIKDIIDLHTNGTVYELEHEVR